MRRGRGSDRHVAGAGPGPGSTVPHYFHDQEKAQGFADELRDDIARRHIGASTIDHALDRYKKVLVAKGTKEKSATETLRRLRQFFAPRPQPAR